jgi:hypothetical protein
MLHYLAHLARQDENAVLIDAMIEAQTNNALAGIDRKKRERRRKLRAGVFIDDRNADRLRMTLEGGNALKLRLAMKTKVIEYFGRLGLLR